MASYGVDGKISLDELNDNLKSIESLKYDSKEISDDNRIETIPATVEVDGTDIRIEDGEKVTVLKMKKAEVDKVCEENSTIDGEKGNYNNPVIPKGFKAINVDTANWEDENGYQNGLVIEDVSAGDETTKGSQFVWVPVQNFEEFHLIEGFMNDSLQEYVSGAIISYPSKEAGSSTKRKLPGKPSENNSVIGTAESVAMYQSVKEYKGFYIARYEARS